jgi:hypothetical protein
MSDHTHIQKLADQILELMDQALEDGTDGRHVVMALDDARRQWMIDNIEKLVLPPPREAD